MLDEHTQVELPIKLSKQTMTERTSIPQRQEEKTLDELYKVFKGLLNTVDKSILLQQLKQIADVDRPSHHEQKSNLPLITGDSIPKAVSTPFCHYKADILPRGQRQLEKRPPNWK